MGTGSQVTGENPMPQRRNDSPPYCPKTLLLKNKIILLPCHGYYDGPLREISAVSRPVFLPALNVWRGEAVG